MALHLLGIRHHGPGSARNVKAYLEKLKPDIVLIEGPPEADSLLEWVAHKELKPPVALLCYQPDSPQQSVFYPFAAFSPEWQAILYARQAGIPVRFMDLPIAQQLALEQGSNVTDKQTDSGDAAPVNNEEDINSDTVLVVRKNPIAHIAEAAGFDDGEKWWEHMFEFRRQNEDVFEAVQETMQELRTTYAEKDNRLEALREAYMRRTIRQATKELYTEIAVICGAWHVPALADMPAQKEDNELLKGLPKVKVDVTWIPWTYDRLSFYSGYGAGIQSPGWYDHQWQYPEDDGTRWMAKVAQLFRKQQMDTSVAHIIEAVRLAGSLAALRRLPRAGLEELNEATLSVLCNGENIQMSLVYDELIVSNRIGEVPVDIPKPPLQVDIEKLQKKLRLPPSADWKDYTLDLRKEMDLERSIFLHRVQLLNIKWGTRSDVSGKGTFKEQWRLQWDPAFSIDIIDKGSWGNTLEEAATHFVNHAVKETGNLPEICRLLDSVIPAELPAAVASLIGRINHLAAASGDVMELMQVLPGMVSITRYGNVRKTDAGLVLEIVRSMIARICVSLPAASTGIDEEAAANLLELYGGMNEAIGLLQDEALLASWQQTLKAVAESRNSSPLLAGFATRLLSDQKILEGEALVKAFHFAMSTAAAPAMAAAWLEGFLKGSGTLLLLDNNLWTVVNNWVEQLNEDVFLQVLPLLRRCFSHFTSPERRKLGEKAKGGGVSSNLPSLTAGIDSARARQGIPVIMQLLGYKD